MADLKFPNDFDVASVDDDSFLLHSKAGLIPNKTSFADLCTRVFAKFTGATLQDIDSNVTEHNVEPTSHPFLAEKVNNAEFAIIQHSADISSLDSDIAILPSITEMSYFRVQSGFNAVMVYEPPVNNGFIDCLFWNGFDWENTFGQALFLQKQFIFSNGFLSKRDSLLLTLNFTLQTSATIAFGVRVKTENLGYLDDIDYQTTPYFVDGDTPQEVKIPIALGDYEIGRGDVLTFEIYVANQGTDGLYIQFHFGNNNRFCFIEYTKKGVSFDSIGYKCVQLHHLSDELRTLLGI